MRYLFLLAVIVTLAACQSEKITSKYIFADFFVRYLETERQLKAHAAFFEGDSLETATPIIFETNVKLQNFEMKPRQVEEDKRIRYVFNGTGAYDSTFIFQYTDQKGRDQAFKMSMSPIRDFSVKEGASLSKGMVVTLDCDPFKANESLILLFTSEKNQSAMAEFQGPFDLKELVVPAVQIAEVQPGVNFLYLVKKQQTIVKAPKMETTSSIEFYSKTIEVQINE
ncbi:MAG: hypothetical protein SFU99_11645 [Saprospiraceae bacterium]|nr:hypothetical protein [Saprospiraceae bacterium]